MGRLPTNGGYWGQGAARGSTASPGSTPRRMRGPIREGLGTGLCLVILGGGGVKLAPWDFG